MITKERIMGPVLSGRKTGKILLLYVLSCMLKIGQKSIHANNLKNEKKMKFKQLYPNCFHLTDFIPQNISTACSGHDSFKICSFFLF